MIAPTVDTLNGDPKGLKREEVSTALQKALPALAPCLQGSGGANVGLSFEAAPEGRAANIKVTGASAEAERCVSNALAAVKLPSFEGKAVPLQFPLNVYQAPPPAPPPPPPAPPPPAPGAAYTPPSALPTSGAASGNSGGAPSTFIKP
jgi:hypothetical protein